MADSQERDRRYLSYLGKPRDEADVEARDEALEVLAWADAQLARPGVGVLCTFDY